MVVVEGGGAALKYISCSHRCFDEDIEKDTDMLLTLVAFLAKRPVTKPEKYLHSKK